MATITLDGKTRVTWVAAVDGIVDTSAPTTTELNAGTDLQDSITPDGLNITAATGSIDNSNLGSTFTTNQSGRRSYSGSLKIQRNAVTNDTIQGLLTYQADGFIVVRRGVAKGTAWTASQECQVYVVECGEPSVPASAAEQLWTYEVPLMFTDDANTSAVVAA